MIRKSKMATDKTMDQWRWQEPGQAWHGRGIYHLTLTQTDRTVARLGELVAPDNPEDARIAASPLGCAVVDCLRAIPAHHPEVEIYAYCLMPDHLHAVLHVTRQMPVGIMTVVRGFWQGCKKAAARKGDNGEDAGQLFGEMPFVRPMSRKGQLNNMIRYVHDNPRRLAVKRLHPGMLRVMHGVQIADMRMDAVGALMLLQTPRMQTVHVRRKMVEEAEHGNTQPLRDYMNGCIIAARSGVLLISPFISPEEKRIREQLIKEQLPFVQLQENGFPPLYKPDGLLIEAVGQGRVLILAQGAYLPKKPHITREECRQLNALADQITSAAE